MGSKFFNALVGADKPAPPCAPAKQPLTKRGPLAHRDDFCVGDTLVRPSLRLFQGVGPGVTAEPRVMRVMLALADARGAVLSRYDLIHICWDDMIVGDEAITRAVFELRRIGRKMGGSFEVETIARVGYRLIGRIRPATEHQSEAAITPPTGLFLNRRSAIGGAAAMLTLAGIASLVFLPRPDPRAAALRLRGEQALRDEMPESDEQGTGFLREAVALEPQNATGWGLLALALRNVSEHASAGDTTSALQGSERATARALAIDPDEPNALAARATLRPEYGDWYAAEDRLRAVLAAAPDHAYSLGSLGYLMESVGRSRESAFLTARAAELQPLSPVHQYRLAYKHWILGRLTDADQVIDRAVQLWPRHPSILFARLLIYVWTGRYRPALGMLDDYDAIKIMMPPQARQTWEVSIRALQGRRPEQIARARAAQIAAAIQSPGSAVMAVQILSLLGLVGDAFAVSEGYLLRRGAMMGSLRRSRAQFVVNDQERRKTAMLFNPCTAAMRADSRFLPLVEAMGLSHYWTRRGIVPDFQSVRR